MKSATFAIIAVLGLCGLQASEARAQGHSGHYHSGHFDYVPHTTTHYDFVPHNGHVDVVPHTTTHYDSIWHNTDNGWNTNNGWNSGYGGYIQGGNVVQGQTVVTNSIPTTSSGNVIPARTGGTITLTNPADNGGPVKYQVNTFSYTAKPGDLQTLNNDRVWTITFDNGRGRRVNHRLERGGYEFRVDDTNGWSLARVDDGEDAPPPPRGPAATK